jgi:threonine/homoserine/homoserine lactone efflux protein
VPPLRLATRPAPGHPPQAESRSMETEKILTFAAMIIAGLLTLLFVLDLALGIPFARQSVVLDVLFVIGGAFILWQGYETYRELS